ncbi:carboxypeptidase-like regulatory domain-containing protein [Fibrella forsythiae]|uniref:Carboxypeptidase-like regulatory domain-containing protein n=1 Tax=Fibrella forsythiae TaxID=2817061 RepID=A0ABS3JPJ0_9BACT|nr:carboxypeptidase-like regulatory domain-containing protein [Fibrella forsythiae]MBO0951331.1 carboxypeptidase-like regulatory domain-containing protein [Fibrella forsythiae]
MTLLKFTLLALLAYCLTIFLAHAQTIPAVSRARLSGRVQRSDGTPLAFVNIGIPGTAVGTVSDEQGRYSLVLKPETNPADSVRFSMLGYGSGTYTVAVLQSEIANNVPVVLTEMAQQLAEVRVLASAGKAVGSSKIDTRMKNNMLIGSEPDQNLGSEVGRRFNLPGKPAVLTEYRAYVKSNFKSVTLRVNIYEANNMRPLLTRNVYVTLPEKHNDWITVDLAPYNIVASGDVVASLQWVRSEGKGTYLALPLQMPVFATHLYKYGSQNNWKKFRGMTTPMTLAYSTVGADQLPQPESVTLSR